MSCSRILFTLTSRLLQVSKTVWDWELINANKPIWTRAPKDISEDEYTAFYKAFTRQEKVR